MVASASARRLYPVSLPRPRLKEWRAVATRYEKTAASFLGVLCLAATADWLKP
jgi:transposase